jgi:predicted phosphodiesterase
MDVTWQRERLGTNVFRVNIPCTENKDFEFWALLSSDRHWDNPHSDRELQKEHLDLAKERGAVVIDCGDLFCMMQGKFDKRSSKASVRPEHQVDNYFDAVVGDAARWLAPYAENLLTIGVGNHENSVKKRHEIDVTERLVTLINAFSGGSVYNGHFSGWVIFRFTGSGDKTNGSINLHYDHGYGGGGPVTADMIQHQRRTTYLPDADIVISGHTHDMWTREFSRVRLSQQGNISHDVQTHIKLPTYKEEYGDGSHGWHPERGAPPKPIGAWWLRFFYERKFKKIIYEVIRAS